MTTCSLGCLLFGEGDLYDSPASRYYRNGAAVQSLSWRVARQCWPAFSPGLLLEQCANSVLSLARFAVRHVDCSCSTSGAASTTLPAPAILTRWRSPNHQITSYTRHADSVLRAVVALLFPWCSDCDRAVSLPPRSLSRMLALSSREPAYVAL